MQRGRRYMHALHKRVEYAKLRMRIIRVPFQSIIHYKIFRRHFKQLLTCRVMDRYNMAHEWKPFFNENPPSPPESRKFRRNSELEDKPSAKTEIKSDSCNASTKNADKPISETESIATKEGSSST